MTPHEVSVYAQDVTEEKWEFAIRTAWLSGQLSIPAYHDPKKFPKSAESLLRKPGEKMSHEEMHRIFESLVGDYGDVPPPPPKK